MCNSSLLPVSVARNVTATFRRRAIVDEISTTASGERRAIVDEISTTVSGER